MDKKYKRIVDIAKYIEKGKVLVIYGPRQVGKTYLVKEYIANTGLDYLKVQGDELKNQLLFSVPDSEKIFDFLGRNLNIFIDEAQMIPNIGSVLKLLIDLKPELNIIITGSSSFELSGQVGEPLFGRHKFIYLFPLSYGEFVENNIYGYFERLEKIVANKLFPGPAGLFFENGAGHHITGVGIGVGFSGG